MDTLKRYWNALGDDARKPLKRVVILNIVLSVLVSLVTILLFGDLIFGGHINGDTFLQRWTIMGFLLLTSLAFLIYSYYLIYRAHKAIKALLFSKPAPGRKTPETWTGGDGFFLAVSLFGVTSIPQLPMLLLLGILLPNVTPIGISDFLWPAIGIFLAPVAAKRYIPLDDGAQTA